MNDPHFNDDVELVLQAKSVELGAARVFRALPQVARRSVGPFVFLDHLGGNALGSKGEGGVLSHPHIGLSTVTYLFDGEATHLDSLGVVQVIKPGDVNWMTAGRGVVHAERGAQSPELAARLGGLQLWVALPRAAEDCEPSFEHYAAASLPSADEAGARLRVLAGSLWGLSSPVKTSSPSFYADVRLEPGAVVSVPANFPERAAYVAEGSLEVGLAKFTATQLVVFRPRAEVLLRALEPTRLLLLGGEPLDGPRFLHWNFVSSRRERLEQAKADWRAHRFARVPNERTYVPLPSDGATPQLYPEFR
jgi:redox-sensitive bicupin YhaK (pirin superfamily)